jgi:hypothetical protein
MPYKIISKGLKEEADALTVLEQLARVFKTTPEKLEKYLFPCHIKTVNTLAEAQKYRATLESAGLQIQVLPVQDEAKPVIQPPPKAVVPKIKPNITGQLSGTDNTASSGVIRKSAVDSKQLPQGSKYTVLKIVIVVCVGLGLSYVLYSPYLPQKTVQESPKTSASQTSPAPENSITINPPVAENTAPIDSPELQSQSQPSSSTPTETTIPNEDIKIATTPGTFTITPPADTTVHAGEKVQFNFSQQGGTPQQGAVLFIGHQSFELTGNPPYSLEYTVPDTIVGQISIKLMTFHDHPDAEIYIAESSLNIQQTEPPQALAVNYTELQLSEVGDTEYLSLEGQFAGEKRLDLTAATTGTQYKTQSGNDTIISISPDGIVEAKGKGEDTILITYGALSSQVKVTVGASQEDVASEVVTQEETETTTADKIISDIQEDEIQLPEDKSENDANSNEQTTVETPNLPADDKTTITQTEQSQTDYSNGSSLTEHDETIPEVYQEDETYLKQEQTKPPSQYSPPPDDSYLKKINPVLLAAFLSELSYYAGDFERPSTIALRNAIKKLQQDLGVEQTGVLDKLSWDTLKYTKLTGRRAVVFPNYIPPE